MRRALTRLTALSLILCTLAIFAQLILAALSGALGVLFAISAAFTATLLIPLVLQSVLHPEIRLSADGIWLRPMLWREQFVPRRALLRCAPHPLISSSEANAALERLLFGRKHRRREGYAIIVARDALPPPYRLLARLADAPDAAAFAISNTTHRNYDQLCQAIAALLADSTD
jgi:hypothetical protein